jgi:uncharacterized protein YggE
MKKQLLTLVSLAFLLPVFSQQIANPYPKTITVTGSAEMEVVPDQIYVIVDLKEYEKKGQGKIDLESIKSQFLRTAKEVGIPDTAISIASYEGYNNPWLRKKKKTELYSSISYQIIFSKSADMDRMVDKLDDNATQNFSIVKTSHSKLEQFKKQLKIQAVKAARDKAIYLSDAIGEKIGDAVTINEPGENIYYPMYRNMAANKMLEVEQSVAVDVAQPDFKKIKLRYDVTVVFALK